MITRWRFLRRIQLRLASSLVQHLSKIEMRSHDHSIFTPRTASGVTFRNDDNVGPTLSFCPGVCIWSLRTLLIMASSLNPHFYAWLHSAILSQQYTTDPRLSHVTRPCPPRTLTLMPIQLCDLCSRSGVRRDGDHPEFSSPTVSTV